MLLNWSNSQGLNALMNSAEFIAGFADKGSGEVDLVLSRGTGSATFTRATTATTVNSAGTIISVASGTPRSYYDPTTLQYLGYLAEGARTNICLQSQDFSTTWANIRTTESVNSLTSPDGTLTADKLIEDSSVTTTHYIGQVFTGTAAAYSHTVFAKAGERGWLKLEAYNGATSAGAYFNLSTGAIGTTDAGVTATVKAYPNGWYRLEIVRTLAASAACEFDIYLATGDGGFIYTGNGASGAYLWGAQIELGAFASTYIPTTTASVPRNADVLTYPFAGNASASVGSAYAEASSFWTTAPTTPTAAVQFGSSGQILVNGGSVSTTFRAFDGTNVADISGLSSTTTAPRKRASSWGGSTMSVTGDGASPTIASFDGAMSSTAIGIGVNPDTSTAQWFGTIRNVRIYQTQLSASQLQAVTA